jgi:hypothetical protein
LPESGGLDNPAITQYDELKRQIEGSKPSGQHSLAPDTKEGWTQEKTREPGDRRDLTSPIADEVVTLCKKRRS